MNFIKLMYITNDPEVALLAESAGVNRIFVDMEYINKELRQGGMDTVQSKHTIEDVKGIRAVIKNADVMVRCNPIHDATDEYSSSKEEIDQIIDAGADIIMLPYFKTVDEVKTFIDLVGGRAKTFPLVETKEAVECVDQVLELDGVDEIYIGLNDLSLSWGKKFMFELLADGTVETLCTKFKQKGIPYGFGGIASIGAGELPAEYIIREHYRLGSTCGILSRSFCRANLPKDEIKSVFTTGIQGIRDLEEECKSYDLQSDYFENNKKEVAERVRIICEK